MSWQLQEAKQKSSELVRRTLEEGPQVVTKHGEEVVASSPATRPTSLEPAYVCSTRSTLPSKLRRPALSQRTFLTEQGVRLR